MDNQNDNNMQAIIYQGREIEAELVGEMGGYMGKLRGHGRNGEDQLFRDEAGRYYLRQKRYVEEGNIQWMSDAERAGVLFERVHAINVNAAILWAISFTGSDGWKLRCDAADLLMEGRDYSDPHPTHLNAGQRAMVADPGRFAKQREPSSDQKGGYALRFINPADGSVWDQGEIGDDLHDAIQVRADQLGVDWAQALVSMVKEHFAKHCEPAAGSGRITVELDDLASAMLRETCKEGDACRAAGEDLRDLVNAAVTFYLTDDRNDQHGEFDLSNGADALERAKRDRQSLEAGGRESSSTSTDHAAGPEPVESQSAVHRFVFDYPATEKVCGRRRTVEVTDAEMARAIELAAAFGLTTPQFLRGLADHNDLPGQPCRLGNKLRDSLHVSHIAFVCMDEEMAARIERAAQARSQTADEFVANAVGGDVDLWEEGMLLHPVTGELLEAEHENLYTELAHDYQITAPPIGREHEPQFQGHPGRQYVRFGAYLTPAQLEQCHFTEKLHGANEGQEGAVLLQFDAAACPCLEVDGKRIKLGHTFQSDPQEAGGMLVRLDAEASALVRRYLDVTPFDYTAAHILSGSVTYALEPAFNDLPAAQRLDRVDSAEFHDGAWGYVEEEIYNARQRQLGLPEHDGSDQTVRVPVFTQDQLGQIGRAQVAASRRPAKEPDPAALHSLNAATPEAVEEVEEARQGEPAPIRDVLLDLAADWRIRAQEARAAGRDATPLTASHKLHGQADLLETCAEQIEAVVNGKEGR